MSFFKKLFGRGKKEELEKQEAEAKRIAEEQARIAAEKAAEEQRLAEEERRAAEIRAAEAKRAAQEQERIAAEKAAEAKRLAEEQEREMIAKAEAAKLAAEEQERALAAQAAQTEEERQALAAKAEAAKKQAEEEKKALEAQAAEAQRVAAEKQRAAEAQAAKERKIAEERQAAIDAKAAAAKQKAEEEAKLAAEKAERAKKIAEDERKAMAARAAKAEAEAAAKKEAEKAKSKTSFWGGKKDLDKGLEKTKSSFFGKLSRAVAGKSTVDEEVLDEVEQVLITSDVGLDTTIKIIERIEARVAKDKYLNTSELNAILRDEIVQLLAENNTEDVHDFSTPPGKKPYIMLVVGVNGVGKTTTIGKLAYQLTKQGKKVVIGAGDTFRAAAVDQLEIWSNRVGCEFFSKGMYTDPAAVAYETAEYAIANNCDVAIIDTAGRLHTKVNLMKELGKIKRSVGKCLDGAPHDVMLVLDATTGQNAIEQATKFTAATDVSCLALTKLDGTAKGGVAIGISDQFKIPIKYIGIGEGMEQLQVFNKKEFVESMFGGAPVV
jgi:fused signal recognition particle receptor